MYKCLIVSCSFVLLLISLGATAQPQDGDSSLWQALQREGHFAMMRHALAPGTGDPDNFALNQRQTQRNLSQRGREQAKRIGDRFRSHGIKHASVFSSQWFRCMDTARLLDLGEAKALPALNSFFRDYANKEPQMRELKAWLGREKNRVPLVLVTHQVNITALTGVFPSSGEIVVIKQNKDDFEVLGRIATD